MTLSKRQQIKASKIIDKWEGITGVDAINARQATTLQGVKDGLRADMTTFRHMYESADRAMSTLIDQLDELDPTKFDDGTRQPGGDHVTNERQQRPQMPA